jgi:hypothetical protein
MSQLVWDHGVSLFTYFIGLSNNKLKLAPRHSKTKAMRDAPWRSLKPKSFPGKSLSTPRTQKVAARPPKKKRKASSGQGLSKFRLSFCLRTNAVLTAVQFTVPDHEDSAEEVPRRHVRSHGSREDSVDMPPPSQYTLKKRVQARDQSDESETPEDSDSSDKSEECNDDLQNLNSRELAHTFENEVSRRRKWGALVLTHHFLGYSMGWTWFAIVPTHRGQPQQEQA